MRDPSATVLQPSPAYINQMAYINAGSTPFALNVAVSYKFGSQPVREVGIGARMISHAYKCSKILYKEMFNISGKVVS